MNMNYYNSGNNYSITPSIKWMAWGFRLPGASRINDRSQRKAKEMAKCPCKFELNIPVLKEQTV